MCPSEGAVPPPRCNQSATTRLGSRTAAWRSLELEVAPSCPLNVKRSFGLFFTFGGGGELVCCEGGYGWWWQVGSRFGGGPQDGVVYIHTWCGYGPTSYMERPHRRGTELVFAVSSQSG